MAGQWTHLKGVSNIGDPLLLDNLGSNVVSFFEWGLLNVGNFFSVNRPGASGVYGGSQFRLRVSEDKNYLRGQVWEGFRSNWVWESGIDYQYQPIAISGIYTNGTFVPNGSTGPFAFTVNYPLGRVIFSSGIPTNTQVEVNYSYKWVNVYEADSQWFKDVQFNSFRLDNEHFNQYGSGIWSTFAQNRVQLPAVIVESVPNRTFKPRQLGGGQFVYQDMLFHIFSEDYFMRNQLVDIITFQKYKKINLYDKNAIINAGRFPVNYDGSISPSALCYPDLLNQFPNDSAYFYETSSQSTENLTPSLYQGIVRATMELELPNI